MLNDSYIEQSFRAKPEKLFYVKMALSVWVTCIGVLMFLFITPQLGMIIVVVGISLMVYAAGEGRMEYEYTITNGNVDIAAIYNASRRRERMRFELEQVTMVVPKDSNRISHETFKKTRNYTSGYGREQEIALVVEMDGNKELILMEPDEKSLEHIKNYTKNKYYDI